MRDSEQLFDWDYDPITYPRMGQLLKKKRESESDAGFFEIIQNLFSVDYLGVEGKTIDRMLWSRIALRSPAPIVVHVHDDEDTVRLTYEERVELARMMYSYYKVKWDKQKAVVAIEYDPIHNYLDEWSDQSEGEDTREGSSSLTRVDTPNLTVNKSNTRTDNLMETQSFGGTETRTDNLSELTTHNTTDTRTDNLQSQKTVDMTEEQTDDISKKTEYHSGVSEGKTDSKTTTFGKTETTTYDTTDETTYNVDEDENYNQFKERDDYHSSNQRTDNLTEAKDYGKTSTRTDNLLETKTYGGTDTRTDNLTQTDSGDNGTKENQIYAFNSVSYQPSTKEIHTNWDGNTRHNTGTQSSQKGGQDTTSDTGTQGTVEGGQDTTTNTGTQTDAKTGYDEKTKSGAIERTKDGTETLEKDGTVGVVQGGTEGVTASGSSNTSKTGYDEESTDGSVTKDTDGTETTVNTGTQANAKTGTETVANTGTQSTQKGGSDTVANTGTQTDQGSEVTTGTNQRVDTGSDSISGTSSKERSGVHSGNIGNLTSQKQIGEEIALWKWNFIEEIMTDATEFLTLQVYC